PKRTRRRIPSSQLETMNEIPNADPLGLAAVVSYLPDPLGSYLRQLRDSLPGEHNNPQAHITILPPRPLPVPVQTAAPEARATLQRFRAFAVELVSVRAFPGTNVLYIEPGEGDAGIRGLHEALNAGSLAAAEQFEFRPHLTISGPMPDGELPKARHVAEKSWLAADFPRRFTLGELVFLWHRPDGHNGEWTRLWSQSLKPAQTAAALTARTY
ncbi:MAG: 2'-5' RNA ligase family protein, partial [Bryobacteraceae bacterium]